MTAAELMVRMGELAVSSTPGEVLASIGLGSCIGLALLDTRKGVAGLAHVMLPSKPSDADVMPGKFAGTAVPALVESMVEVGSSGLRLEAVLVGGAQMFSFGGAGAGKLDVGARNEEATRAALAAARIPVRAAATAGAKGRTIKVSVEGPLVTVKEAGGAVEVLFGEEAR
ncbi:MAG: chemotaxis protein CheD [Thermoleophilaceae bacterium]